MAKLHYNNVSQFVNVKWNILQVLAMCSLFSWFCGFFLKRTYSKHRNLVSSCCKNCESNVCSMIISCVAEYSTDKNNKCCSIRKHFRQEWRRGSKTDPLTFLHYGGYSTASEDNEWSGADVSYVCHFLDSFITWKICSGFQWVFIGAKS